VDHGLQRRDRDASSRGSERGPCDWAACLEPDDAPGFSTRIEHARERAARQVWVCRETLVGPLYLSDFDETVPGGGKTCYRLSDIADGLTVARESLKVLRYLQRIL